MASSSARGNASSSHGARSSPFWISRRTAISALPRSLLPLPAHTPQPVSPHSLVAMRLRSSVLHRRSRRDTSRRNLSRSSFCISGRFRLSQSAGSGSFLPSWCAMEGLGASRMALAASASLPALAAWNACSTLA